MTLSPVPKLQDLLADPAKLNNLPLEAVPHLRGELARLDSLLLSRLLSGNTPQAGNDGERLLEVQEAAAKLGVSEDWLYRHSSTLPFTVRVGKKQLRFSGAGIERYIRQKTGR